MDLARRHDRTEFASRHDFAAEMAASGKTPAS
ncbi:MAG: hypothetical protein QOF32_504 [Gammaproteobacteria bacterium]|jgi:hypothetical protein|nr:hypothetical protein [Gammaproteobacteria bacterium]